MFHFKSFLCPGWMICTFREFDAYTRGDEEMNIASEEEQRKEKTALNVYATVQSYSF